MKKIRLYGAGGHSQVIRETLEMNEYEITEVFDDYPLKKHYLEGKVLKGVKTNNKDFPHSGDEFIIAIGDNRVRANVANSLKSDFGKAIHNTAIISPNSQIKKGTVVFAGAVVQTNSCLGKHVIINTGASVDHDCIIEDFVHISPKSVLCGGVHVKEGAHVGAGAIVLPNVKIGKWSIVGAGAIVLRDVPDNSTVVGSPAKILLINEPAL